MHTIYWEVSNPGLTLTSSILFISGLAARIAKIRAQYQNCTVTGCPLNVLWMKSWHQLVDGVSHFTRWCPIVS